MSQITPHQDTQADGNEKKMIAVSIHKQRMNYKQELSNSERNLSSALTQHRERKTVVVGEKKKPNTVFI